ncbi:MAG TPA: LLM class flavin-dependent oxidoreductase [Candidatus Sulfotelmatobacter sp.]|nr:LLM class flavin-dependent oxidoreductase [Candidatus Sulfotelmatobacter sp.]
MAHATMHLGQFLVHGPTYHSLAMWRHPRTAAAGFDWTRPELYQHIARVCERGKFDLVFFADVNFISDTYKGSLDPAIRYATQVPEHDPIPLLSFMAASTSTIGLGATYSISHQHPFHAARLWATLDHLTAGRAAWNVVTTLNHNQSANYGEELRPPDERYDRAHEFIQVCRKLWDSWAADAVVMDRAAGVFADPSKVHRIEHVGRFYKSRGPLNVVRSPQNGPAILQAGTSGKGRAFAALYADAVFAIQPNLAGAKAYFDDVKRAVVEAGREPDACKILFGVQPIVGGSRAEALDKQAEHNALVPLEGGLAILSGHLDFDLSTLPLDTVMATRTEPRLQRFQTRYRSLDGRLLTLREVAQNHGQSVGLPQMVGTPAEVADQLVAFFDHVGGDGFMLSPIYCPGAIEEFVDLVVPELQRRGRFRRDYDGKTQRAHLRA